MRERVPSTPVTALIVVRAIAGATLLVAPRRVPQPEVMRPVRGIERHRPHWLANGEK